MRKIFALGLLISSTVAVASSPPFPVQNVKTHQADGLSRLRIHLAVSSNNDSGEINVSNLTLCSALACWKTEINRYIPVANSVTAKGELIADVFVPENELIKEIFFGKTVGKQSIGGGLKLSEAVKIDAEYQGTNLYVVLNKFRKNSGATEYFPMATTALPYNPEAKYYLIDPKFNQNIDLSSTSTVGFPAGNTVRAKNTDVGAGNKLVLGMSGTKAMFFFETSSPSYNFQSYGYNLVSSSTSVVKNGVCATSVDSNRWSAIGANTSTGEIVLVSSTSSGTTTAADLCAVFKAFGINNALRLDGGPSAAMVISGAHLNPLSGAYYLKYGNSRYIAYPIRVGN